MKQRGISDRILCFMLAFVICFSSQFAFGNVQAAAKKNTTKASTAKASSKKKSSATIKVHSATKAIARKIDAKLMAGKAVTLKVKGNKKSATRIVKKVQKKIKKVNRQGVIFQYEAVKKKKNYYIFEISRDNARLYKYSVKFIKKLYKRVFESYESLYPEIKTYPNINTLVCHWLYDYGVEKTPEHVQPDDWCECGGNDEPSTNAMNTWYWQAEDKNRHEFWENYPATPGFDKLIEHVFGENWLMKKGQYSSEDSQVYSYIDIMTYKEFYKILINKMGSEQKVFDYLKPYMDRYHRLWLRLTTDFCDLSDAMKVYMIDQSGYFECCTSSTKFGMVYDLERALASRNSWQGMRTLYRNKATGVCHDYAVYECLVFRQLGITCYHNSSGKIDHEWSVVKVKNSKGKTLWIPFDYGIGPATNLAVTDEERKYINTEAKRYKLYLKGIKGAPKKKNFKDSDFN